MLYQLIYLGLTFLGLGLAFAKHGQPKEEKWNGWISLLTASFVIFILYKGGFFNVLLNNI